MFVIPTTIGTRLQFYRHVQGLSRFALARLSHLQYSQLYNLEKDKTSCTIPTLQRIAQALGVTCGHLLGEVPLLDNAFPHTPEDGQHVISNA